jgi:hypothetical protein
MNHPHVPTRMPLWQRFSPKTCKRAFVMIASLFISINVFAHAVTGYTGSCITGPKFSLDAIVTNVNSTSNYAWQYKNASNVWVCILNGNNTINGNVYNVSGATSTATTNPAPIVFNNPNSGLNGLVIRCVISDGAGVNPCNMPVNNTWNSNSSSVNHTINVSNTPCAGTCTGRVTSLYFNKLDGGADLPITNGGTYTTAQLGSLYNFEATATGTVGSIKFTISGPTASSNTENAVPYNSPGTGNGAWTGAPGAYSVNLKTYSGSDGSGTQCHDTTVTFNVTNDCNCPSTLLTNGSFENGQTGWTVTGGSFSYGPEYKMCGAKNGYLNHSSGTAKIYQDVTGIPVGATVNFKGYAGTHAPGLACSPKLSLIFLNASNGAISQANVNVTKDVGSGNQVELYTITAVVPAGTVKVRVQGSITCNTLKVDGFCLYYVVPNGSIGDFVWKDLNSDGIQDAGEPGVPAVVVTLTKPDASTVVTETDANGAYLFSNLPAGSYSVSFETPVGYVPTIANEETADEATDSDPVGGVVTPIALAAGQNLTTVDAGFIQLVSLSGNVWHDVNAMNDNLVNNTGAAQAPPASAIPVGLRVYLVNTGTGLVERVTLVSSGTGTFSFADITPNTNYRLYLSMAIYAIGTPEVSILTTIPSSWEHTGQKNANPPASPLGSDGINDGRLAVPVGNTNVINVNFGIRVKGGTVVIG